MKNNNKSNYGQNKNQETSRLLRSKMSYDPSKFERPSVTADILIFTIEDSLLKILLVKRTEWPFEGRWAIPGGFISMHESLEETAQRKLKEEAGVSKVYLEQLYTFGKPKRDPRTRVITVSYFALVPLEKLQTNPDKKFETKLVPVNKLPSLAFDHNEIVEYGVDRLKAKINYSNIAFSLLPKVFRLSDLQKIYEAILGQNLDKRNFRKWISTLDLVEATGKKELHGAHRPAMLYIAKKGDLVVFK